jgi:hypothetical protein
MTPTHKTGPLAEHPLRAPVLWGAAWGLIQAAAPLGFWWLDPGWPAPEDPGGDDDAELDGRSPHHRPAGR